MAVGQFRARSGTEIVDATFQLVKSNYAPLVTIAAIGSLPLILASFITQESMAHGTGPILTALILRVIYAVTVFLMQIALIRASSDAYLGRPINIGGSFKVSGSTALSIMGAGFVAGLATAVGFIFLIIPGFIAFAWFFLAPAVVILEGANTSEALKRSKFLGSEKKLAILGGMLVFVFAFMIAGVAAATLGFLTGSSIVIGVFSALLMMLVWPIYPAFMTLHYYDSRIRKEGYDIELMANSISQSPSAPGPTVA